MMQEENHIFQGLRRDNHQIRQDAKFFWDAHNVRITAREDSSLFSITNEKGTSEPLVELKGNYVGHCVLGKYIVVFTNKDNSEYYIYRIEQVANTYKVVILFCENKFWDKGWSTNNPIEALGVYETELIQKVYWIDGVNQPRVINITKPEYKLKDTEYLDIISELPTWDFSNIKNNVKSEGYTEVEWENFLTRYNNTVGVIYKKDSFDFVRELYLGEEIEVTRGEGNGIFSPGTIQYAFSYFNKYEQETNIFYTTPLYYISPLDRGGNPQERVANFFTIKIWDADTDFDYIRIYSIHRSSIDAVPVVKLVEDVAINKQENITYVDDGTKGSNIDPTQLLYTGGRSIVAECIETKDNTLFLGNIKLLSNSKDLEDIVKADYEISEPIDLISTGLLSGNSSYYDYIVPLKEGNIAGFKGGETYRLGIQVQTSDGTWLEPMYLGDMVLNDFVCPTSHRLSRAVTINNGEDLLAAGIKKIRTCIVLPKTNERDIICQGVLCPTVYSVGGRNTDSPYAMSSWFFRPAVSATTDVYGDLYGDTIQFRHNYPLFSNEKKGAEIQNMFSDKSITTINDINKSDVDKYRSYFFVDENILTFHSPDLEFDTNLQNLDWSTCRLKIVGATQLRAISGDIDIQTSSTEVYSKDGGLHGFNHIPIGYPTGVNCYRNGGLVSGYFYRSGTIDENFDTGINKYFKVYTWNRSGSLNNDSIRGQVEGKDTGTRSAVLSKKIISNLKFFTNNVPITFSVDKGSEVDNIEYDISTPILFNSEEISVARISPSYLNQEVPYMGNIDTLLTTSEEYPFYIADGFTDAGNTIEKYNTEKGTSFIDSSGDPIRMKFKSSPHLVFSLSGNSPKEINLLPIHSAIGDPLSNKNYSFPDWQKTGFKDDTGEALQYDGDLAYMDIGGFPILTRDERMINRYIFDEIIDDEGIFHYTIARGRRANNGGIALDYIDDAGGKVLRVSAITRSKRIKELNGKEGSSIIEGLGGDEHWNVLYKDVYIYSGVDKYYRLEQNGTFIKGDQTLTDYTLVETKPPTGTFTYSMSQQVFNFRSEDINTSYPYLLLAEIVKDVSSDIKFGGTSEEALKQNLWIPSSRAIKVTTDSFEVPFEYGDTWFSRYDCLKTSSFTREDENQVIEIGSFLCETRVNIDGRYDKNRGLKSNINITPQNFNLINDVYSQKDNFFNYRVLDKDYYKQDKYSNQITWTQEKHAGEDTDTWTHVTLASPLDMNGEKGEVTAIKSWNEYLLCFQEKAISQILFNSRVQIPASDGVPIEISNGYKVDGSRLINGNIGCANKWSIVDTSNGIYFLDSNSDNIYLFSGQLSNLSSEKGMQWWVKHIHTLNKWSPVNIDKNNIRAFYDIKYGDVYFNPGPSNNQEDALCYSEHLGQYTSFMSYGGTQAMFNYNDGFYSLRSDTTTKLYKHFDSIYNNFYGTIKNWDISFISNQNPTYNKIFDTIELRTDQYSNDFSSIPNNTCPINYIQVNNEYQDTGKIAFNNSTVRKKFRIWRGIIPRNTGTRQRIRNPWCKITLGWDATKSILSTSDLPSIIHDISVKYTI